MDRCIVPAGAGGASGYALKRSVDAELGVLLARFCVKFAPSSLVWAMYTFQTALESSLLAAVVP